jgi:hypothetical protein
LACYFRWFKRAVKEEIASSLDEAKKAREEMKSLQAAK